MKKSKLSFFFFSILLVSGSTYAEDWSPQFARCFDEYRDDNFREKIYFPGLHGTLVNHKADKQVGLFAYSSNHSEKTESISYITFNNSSILANLLKSDNREKNCKLESDKLTCDLYCPRKDPKCKSSREILSVQSKEDLKSNTDYLPDFLRAYENSMSKSLMKYNKEVTSGSIKYLRRSFDLESDLNSIKEGMLSCKTAIEAQLIENNKSINPKEKARFAKKVDEKFKVLNDKIDSTNSLFKKKWPKLINETGEKLFKQLKDLSVSNLTCTENNKKHTEISFNKPNSNWKVLLDNDFRMTEIEIDGFEKDLSDQLFNFGKEYE